MWEDNLLSTPSIWTWPTSQPLIILSVSCSSPAVVSDKILSWIPISAFYYIFSTFFPCGVQNSLPVFHNFPLLPGNSWAENYFRGLWNRNQKYSQFLIASFLIGPHRTWKDVSKVFSQSATFPEISVISAIFLHFPAGYFVLFLVSTLMLSQVVWPSSHFRICWCSSCNWSSSLNSCTTHKTLISTYSGHNLWKYS